MATGLPSSPSPTAGVNQVQYESLDFLVQEISVRCHWVVSPLQVAAMLESLGVTDELAQERYGYEDVFALAEKVMLRLPRTYYDVVVENGQVVSTAVSPSPHLTFPTETWRDKIQDYLRGVASLLPMIVLSVGIILHQLVGRWEPYQVWLVGMAMLLSLLVTGGFMQAASRRGSIYLSQGYVSAAQQVIFRIMALCLVVVLAVNGLIVALTLNSTLFTPYDVSLMSVTFVTLSLVWVGASLLYLLDKAHLFLLALLLGVGSSGLLLWLLYNYSAMPYEVVALVAVAVGLLLFMGVTAVSARYALYKLHQASAVGRQPVRLPTNAHLTVSLFPYFMYGAIYVLLIMSGHVAAWVSNPGTADRITAIFDTELALAFALGGTILTSGVSEHTIRRFWKRVQVYQLGTDQETLPAFSVMLTAFYRAEQKTFVRALWLSSLLTAVAAWVFVSVVNRFALIELTWTQNTTQLFLFGLVGYGLMAWGLFQSMFMITLSRPWWVIQALTIGAIATFIVGVTIGLATTYVYAGIGIIIGNLLFLYFTQQHLTHLLDRADYYFFASF